MKNTTIYRITARYKYLLLPKGNMPLFVSFHPHSIVKFEVKLEDNTKLSTFLTTVSKWFEGLRILDITKHTEDVTDDERIS